MAGTNAPSPDALALTVALDLPSAQVLADQASIISDLQFVMGCCKRLLSELVTPEEERDPVVPQALWSAALVAYARCFGKGRRFGLTAEDIQALPLRGEVMKYHKWVIAERGRLTTHSANPFEAAKVGAALAPAGQAAQRVRGVAIFATSHVLVDDAGVRQLGGLASELAKQTAEKAKHQQDAVLADAQQLSTAALDKLPQLQAGPPAAGPAAGSE
jgi:hypothetical protein